MNRSAALWFRYSLTSHHLLRQHRCSMSAFQNLTIDDTEHGYSVLKMHRKPVNSFNLEFINEMIEAVDYVEKSDSSRGLILTSGLKVFSAGLDILEMYNPNQEDHRRDRLREFWTAFQELNLRLHASQLVTIAAINGPSPAGGCALALQCDYRIMAEGRSVIGLNETHLGLTAPYWLCKVFASVIGHRQAEKHLCLGSLLLPQDALNVGIVDDVVPGEELMSTAHTEMLRWLSIPELGRSRTKSLVRKAYVDDFHQRRAEDLEMFTNAVNDPLLQKLLTKYLQALKSK